MFHGRYGRVDSWIESFLAFTSAANIQHEVKCNINIDGIPLYQDSRLYHAYPILLKTCTTPQKIFCTGLYLSESSMSNKMPPINDLLKDFVADWSYLKSILNIQLEINCFSCDAPARSDIKRIVSHNSYHSCDRCWEKGIYKGGHVVLPNLNEKLRTGDEFISKTDGNHHKEGPSSIVESLGVNMV